jgi:hypothetical protein
MRRTRAVFSAAFFASATAVLEAPCVAQEARAYVPVQAASTTDAPQQAAALSPGHSVYWSRIHAPDDTDSSLLNADAVADQIIQANQCRYSRILYLAAVLMDVRDESPPRQDLLAPAPPCR